MRGQAVAIVNSDISRALSAYLERYPDEAALLSEPGRLLSEGGDFASRRNFPVHVTAGALLVRGGAEILLVEHRAYEIMLQPGGHLEPSDATLIGAAVRKLRRRPVSPPAWSSRRRRPLSTSSTAGSRRDRRRTSRSTTTSTSG